MLQLQNFRFHLLTFSSDLKMISGTSLFHFCISAQFVINDKVSQQMEFFQPFTMCARFINYWSFIIIGRIDEAVESYMQDQFEILLYKKNSKLILFKLAVNWDIVMKLLWTRTCLNFRIWFMNDVSQKISWFKSQIWFPNINFVKIFFVMPIYLIDVSGVKAPALKVGEKPIW